MNEQVNCRWLVSDDGLTPDLEHLLLALLGRLNDGDIIGLVSIRVIAKELGLSKSEVLTNLAALEDLQLLRYSVSKWAGKLRFALRPNPDFLGGDAA